MLYEAIPDTNWWKKQFGVSAEEILDPNRPIPYFDLRRGRVRKPEVEAVGSPARGAPGGGESPSAMSKAQSSLAIMIHSELRAMCWPVHCERTSRAG